MFLWGLVLKADQEVDRTAAVVGFVSCHGMGRVLIRCSPAATVTLSADVIAIAQHLDPSAKRRRLEGGRWTPLIVDAILIIIVVEPTKHLTTAAVIRRRLMTARFVTAIQRL